MPTNSLGNDRPQRRAQMPGDAHHHHRIGRRFQSIFIQVAVDKETPFLVWHKTENGAVFQYSHIVRIQQYHHCHTAVTVLTRKEHVLFPDRAFDSRAIPPLFARISVINGECAQTGFLPAAKKPSQ